MCKLLKSKDYVLIIDEALDCIGLHKNVSADDIRILMDSGTIEINPSTERLEWVGGADDRYEGNFLQLKEECLNGNIVSGDCKHFFWQFPSEFFSAFQKIFVLTYLFQGSLMRTYLDAEKVPYEIKTLNSGQLDVFDPKREIRELKALSDRIDIYEGPMNRIGVKHGRAHPLSAGWYRRQDDAVFKKIQSSTRRFMNDVAGTPSMENMWTCFKSNRGKLKGNGYAKGFVPLNAKATNDFATKQSLAYLCNVFVNPRVKQYLVARGSQVFENVYALSEMLQWIWRSRIRESETINLFVPSERMRTLLQEWLKGASIEELQRL